MRFLEEFGEFAVRGMVIFGLGEGADGGVEVVRVDLGLGAVEEGGEGCGVMGQGFGAVGGGAFVVVHLDRFVSSRKKEQRRRATDIDVGVAGHLQKAI